MEHRARIGRAFPLGGSIQPFTWTPARLGPHRSRRCPEAAATSAMALRSAGAGPAAATFVRSRGSRVCSQAGVIDSGPAHRTRTSDWRTVLVLPGRMVEGIEPGIDSPSKGTLVSYLVPSAAFRTNQRL